MFYKQPENCLLKRRWGTISQHWNHKEEKNWSPQMLVRSYSNGGITRIASWSARWSDSFGPRWSVCRSRADCWLQHFHSQAPNLETCAQGDMDESVLSSIVFMNPKFRNHLMVINSKMDETHIHTMECYSAVKISEPGLSVSYLTHSSERKQHVTEKYLHHDIIYGNMETCRTMLTVYAV